MSAGKVDVLATRPVKLSSGQVRFLLNVHDRSLAVARSRRSLPGCERRGLVAFRWYTEKSGAYEVTDKGYASLNRACPDWPKYVSRPYDLHAPVKAGGK